MPTFNTKLKGSSDIIFNWQLLLGKFSLIFCEGCRLNKISTIEEASFIFVVFLERFRVTMTSVNLNELKKLWIIQMIWKLYIYCFLNKFNISSFVLIVCSFENPYSRMDQWATPFLKLNMCSMIFYFPNGPSRMIFFWKILRLIWKMPATLII